MNVTERMEKTGVIPVVVIKNAEDAIPVAKALIAGGIDVMEITMRTAAGIEAIRRVAAGCPEMLVGAGTVLTPEQCRASVEAGARFIVSPGFDAEIVRWCVENGVPVFPGCVTPSEIMAAMKFGIKAVKFFPANVYGGIKAMKGLSGPFGDVKFVPTGGVSAENLAEYLAQPFICAVGGSWLCAAGDIAAGSFDKITSLAREASDIVARVRGCGK